MSLEDRLAENTAALNEFTEIMSKMLATAAATTSTSVATTETAKADDTKALPAPDPENEKQEPADPPAEEPKPKRKPRARKPKAPPEPELVTALDKEAMVGELLAYLGDESSDGYSERNTQFMAIRDHLGFDRLTAADEDTQVVAWNMIRFSAAGITYDMPQLEERVLLAYAEANKDEPQDEGASSYV